MKKLFKIALCGIILAFAFQHEYVILTGSALFVLMIELFGEESMQDKAERERSRS